MSTKHRYLIILSALLNVLVLGLIVIYILTPYFDMLAVSISGERTCHTLKSQNHESAQKYCEWFYQGIGIYHPIYNQKLPTP